MPPPSAETLSSRLFLGPALRTQPDRRLVTLVREGYEVAFEEIMRRYGKPLGRYAAAIVGARSEDVTQDAFSKALLALRRNDAEIELRPWLYRIVRNTALNDLRDRPPSPEALEKVEGGSLSASEEAERREEIAELMARLRALPEPQRAAIVMRELEGLSHEEIAAALGISGGAARQSIHRARIALRNGLGMMIPLPLLRVLIDHGAEAAGASAGGSAIAAGAATAGGAGAGGALKLGLTTALIAGSVGAGVAVQHDRGSGERDASTPAPASSVQAQASAVPASAPLPTTSTHTTGLASGTQAGEDGHGSQSGGAQRGHGAGGDRGRGPDDPGGDRSPGPPAIAPSGQGGGRGPRGPGRGDEEGHPGSDQGSRPPRQEGREGPGGDQGDDGHGGESSPPPPQDQGALGGGGEDSKSGPSSGSEVDGGSGPAEHSGEGGGSSDDGEEPAPEIPQ